MPECEAVTRYSHIFSAAVREILEVGILRDAGGDDLTPRQLDVLRYIALGQHHVDDIARFLDVTGPAATKAIDKLERRGLVVRRPSGEGNGDRRRTYLSCSEKAVGMITRHRVLERQRIEDVLTAFTEEELGQMAILLERYSLSLVSSSPVRDVPCLRCSGHFDLNCPLQLIHSRCPYQEREE